MRYFAFLIIASGMTGFVISELYLDWAFKGEKVSGSDKGGLERSISSNKFKTIFSNPKKDEVRRSLDDLSIVAKKIIEDKEDKVADAVKSKAERYLEEKKLELNSSFFLSEDNLNNIKYLQEEVSWSKTKLNVQITNIETWDLELIFYFIIEEQLTLDEIAKLSRASMGTSEEEWEKIVQSTKTKEFANRIREYKGLEPIVEIEEEVESSLVRDDSYDDYEDSDDSDDRVVVDRDGIEVIETPLSNDEVLEALEDYENLTAREKEELAENFRIQRDIASVPEFGSYDEEEDGNDPSDGWNEEQSILQYNEEGEDGY
jgi:hypothetical protein